MNNLKILLVRHGESDANKEGYIAGSMNSDLTEKGKRQANYLGFTLWANKIKIDSVYSSTLQRAIDTADRIRVFQECRLDSTEKSVNKNKLYFVKTSPKLNEMCFGVTEGKYFDELPDYYKEDWAKFGYPVNVPEQETKEEVVKRAIEGIKEIAEKEKDSETICIVTHGMLLRLLNEHYKGKIEDIVGNAEYIEIEYNYDTKEIIFD